MKNKLAVLLAAMITFSTAFAPAMVTAYAADGSADSNAAQEDILDEETPADNVQDDNTVSEDQQIQNTQDQNQPAAQSAGSSENGQSSDVKPEENTDGQDQQNTEAVQPAETNTTDTVDQNDSVIESGEKTEEADTAVSASDAVTNGWDASQSMYYENGQPVRNAWRHLSGNWYYFGSDGKAYKNRWFYNGAQWFYLGSDGAAYHDRWFYNGAQWFYFGSDTAAYANRWFYNGAQWFYFGEDTAAYANRWWYNGAQWFYFGSDAAAYANRWFYNGAQWFYFGNDAAAYQNTTQVIGGQSYTFDSSCAWTGSSSAVSSDSSATSSTDYRVVCQKGSKKVTVYRKENGNWVVAHDPMTCSVGHLKNGRSITPSGAGRIVYKKYKMKFAHTSGFYVSWTNRGVGFHTFLFKQSANAPTANNIADARLGLNISNGCIRLSIANAKWIYDNVPVNSAVQFDTN